MPMKIQAGISLIISALCVFNLVLILVVLHGISIRR